MKQYAFDLHLHSCLSPHRMFHSAGTPVFKSSGGVNPPCGRAASRRLLDAPAARSRFAGLGDRRHPDGI
jgi:hypothetical protein